MTIKEAVFNYNGRKRLKDIEISHIKWFMRTQNLSVEEAVKAYFEDKEEEKNLTYKELVAEKKNYITEILGHCETCRCRESCIKHILLDSQFTLADLKTILRSECYKN